MHLTKEQIDDPTPYPSLTKQFIIQNYSPNVLSDVYDLSEDPKLAIEHTDLDLVYKGHTQ